MILCNTPHGCVHVRLGQGNQFGSFRPNAFHLMSGLENLPANWWNSHFPLTAQAGQLNAFCGWRGRGQNGASTQLIQSTAPQLWNAPGSKLSHSERSSRTTCLSKPSPRLTILHSQKVLVHNQNVYCFEQTTLPSVHPHQQWRTAGKVSISLIWTRKLF